MQKFTSLIYSGNKALANKGFDSMTCLITKLSQKFATDVSEWDDLSPEEPRGIQSIAAMLVQRLVNIRNSNPNLDSVVTLYEETNQGGLEPSTFAFAQDVYGRLASGESISLSEASVIPFIGPILLLGKYDRLPGPAKAATAGGGILVLAAACATEETAPQIPPTIVVDIEEEVAATSTSEPQGTEIARADFEIDESFFDHLDNVQIEDLPDQEFLDHENITRLTLAAENYEQSFVLTSYNSGTNVYLFPIYVNGEYQAPISLLATNNIGHVTGETLLDSEGNDISNSAAFYNSESGYALLYSVDPNNPTQTTNLSIKVPEIPYPLPFEPTFSLTLNLDAVLAATTVPEVQDIGNAATETAAPTPEATATAEPNVVASMEERQAEIFSQLEGDQNVHVGIGTYNGLQIPIGFSIETNGPDIPEYLHGYEVTPNQNWYDIMAAGLVDAMQDRYNRDHGTDLSVDEFIAELNAGHGVVRMASYGSESQVEYDLRNGFVYRFTMDDNLPTEISGPNIHVNNRFPPINLEVVNGVTSLTIDGQKIVNLIESRQAGEGSFGLDFDFPDIVYALTMKYFPFLSIANQLSLAEPTDIHLIESAARNNTIHYELNSELIKDLVRDLINSGEFIPSDQWPISANK